MKTTHTHYRNTGSSYIPNRQRGFFSVGLGLGLAALYGLIGTVVVSNHEPGEQNEMVSEQQYESPMQTSAYQPQVFDGHIIPGGTYD